MYQLRDHFIGIVSSAEHRELQQENLNKGRKTDMGAKRTTKNQGRKLLLGIVCVGKREIGCSHKEMKEK